MNFFIVCIALFALIVAAVDAFYIDSAVLGHLAIPALMYGSAYNLMNLGAKLGHGDHHGHHGHHSAIHVYGGHHGYGHHFRRRRSIQY